MKRRVLQKSAAGVGGFAPALMSHEVARALVSNRPLIISVGISIRLRTIFARFNVGGCATALTLG